MQSPFLSITFIINLRIFAVRPSPVDRGRASVFGASEPVRARVGDTVVLPCHCSPSVDLTPLTVEWSRTELRPHPDDRLKRVPFVHVYTDLRDDDPDMKIPEFANRTRLFLDQLSAGVASLSIARVALADQGTYKCFVPKLRSNRSRGWALVTLLVEGFGGGGPTPADVSDLDPKNRNSDQEPSAPTDRAVPATAVAFTVFFVSAVILIVVYDCLQTTPQPTMSDAQAPSTETRTAPELSPDAPVRVEGVTPLRDDNRQTPQVNSTDREHLPYVHKTEDHNVVIQEEINADFVTD